MSKEKVHYSLFGGCRSFISACTQDWCYNTGLWEASRTTDESAVTCRKCLKFLKEADDLRARYLECHVKPTLEMLRRTAAGEFRTFYANSESEMHLYSESTFIEESKRWEPEDGDRCAIHVEHGWSVYYYLHAEWHLVEVPDPKPPACSSCGGSGVATP